MIKRLSQRLYSLVTLLLLAWVAYGGAKLFWQLTVPPATLSVFTLAASTPQTPLLTSVIFRAPDVGVATASSGVPPGLALWRLKGVYLEHNDSVAIIQTPNGSKIVEVGDKVDGDYRIANIRPEGVTLTTSDGKTADLTLSQNRIYALAENTEGAALPPKPPDADQQSASSAQKGQVQGLTQGQLAQRQLGGAALPSNNSFFDWEKHVTVAPTIRQGNPGLKIKSATVEGNDALKRVGLQLFDEVLAIDGQPLSLALWRRVVIKLKKSQKVRAKIFRSGKIQIVILNNYN